MLGHEMSSNAQRRSCRIQLLPARSGPSALSSAAAPSGLSALFAPGCLLSSSTPEASSTFQRSANDVRQDLVRSAMSYKFSHHPLRHSGGYTRSHFIAESLKCLTGETPMPSRLMRYPAELLFSRSDSYFGNWRPEDSLACLNMTLVEYRDKWMTPEEQQVATPLEIRQAMNQGRLRQMQVLWRIRIYAEKREKELEQRKVKAPAFRPPTELFLSSRSVLGDADGGREERLDGATDENPENKVRVCLSAVDSLTSYLAYEYDGIEEVGQSVQPVGWARRWSSPPHEYTKQHLPLRVTCCQSPPRPPRGEDDDLSGLEQFQDCGCKTQDVKCQTCRATAVMVAVEGEIF